MKLREGNVFQRCLSVHMWGEGITGTRSFLGVVYLWGLFLFGGRVFGGGGRVSRGVEATSAVGINPPWNSSL